MENRGDDLWTFRDWAVPCNGLPAGIAAILIVEEILRAVSWPESAQMV